jgi:hypothetical protein
MRKHIATFQGVEPTVNILDQCHFKRLFDGFSGAVHFITFGRQQVFQCFPTQFKREAVRLYQPGKFQITVLFLSASLFESGKSLIQVLKT